MADDDGSPQLPSPSLAAHEPHVEENAAAPEEVQTRRRIGGYTSRIEQILDENPDMSIVITEAGKSHESGGKPIVYTIRTGVSFNGS